jgi:hypothetical protein
LKKILKGISYNTKTDKCLAEKTDYYGTSWLLRETRSGKLYIHESRWYVDGKPKPYGIEVTKFNPAAVIPGNPPRWSDRWEERNFIKPITRAKALTWCIRTQIPRTFHKELKRFIRSYK